MLFNRNHSIDQKLHSGGLLHWELSQGGSLPRRTPSHRWPWRLGWAFWRAHLSIQRFWFGRSLSVQKGGESWKAWDSIQGGINRPDLDSSLWADCLPAESEFFSSSLFFHPLSHWLIFFISFLPISFKMVGQKWISQTMETEVVEPFEWDGIPTDSFLVGFSTTLDTVKVDRQFVFYTTRFLVKS